LRTTKTLFSKINPKEFTVSCIIHTDCEETKKLLLHQEH
jgi:hypothetical protein